MKKRAGLQKKISAIFDGIPLPLHKRGEGHESDALQQPTNVPGAQQDSDQNSSLNAGVQQSPAAEMPTATEQAPIQEEIVKPPAPAPSIPRFQLDQAPPAPQKPQPEHKSEPAKQPPAEPTLRPTLKPRMSKTMSPTLAGYWMQLKVKLYGSPDGTIDKRQLKMTVMMLVLVLVFAYILYSFYLKPKGSRTTTQTQTAQNSSISALELEINWPRPEPYPQNLRDPMSLRSTSSGGYYGGELVVSGIVFGETPMAIINGETLMEGQEILGWKIVKINRDSVEFEGKDGKKMTRRVGQKQKDMQFSQ